ncbi:MAG: hypothetical protein RKO24_08635, partial [Candidatus Competibacter sp.]|nr:hypothetical protein [Candidatus Competibacter sp.]
PVVPPVAPTPPVSTPLPPARPTAQPAPMPPARPVERDPPAARTPASPGHPDSGRSLEEELKSQFDPTVQELEKRLRPRKSP